MAMPPGEALTGPVREGYLYPYDSFGNRIATLRFVQDIPLRPKHPSWETLGSIQKHLHLLEDKPILICWGEQDFCFTLAFLKTWEQYFPDAEVHQFPEAGHYLLESAGDGINPIVAEFLNRPRE
jgi:haloalkane dehalogenase